MDGRFRCVVSYTGRFPSATNAGRIAVREQIQDRLEALKKEREKGQAELQKVEAQRTYLHETVLRISGAIQVLEELLQEGQSPTTEDQLRKG